MKPNSLRRIQISSILVLSSLLLLSLSCAIMDPLYHLTGSTVLGETYKPKNIKELEPDFSIDYSLLIFKPENQNEKFPLLVISHGSGQNAFEYLSLWEKDALDNRIMILAPSYQQSFRKRHVKALHQLIDEIVDQYPIDQDQIWLSGISSGVLMSRLLLADNASKWSAAAFVASPVRDPWWESLGEGKPPPFLYVHGKNDSQYAIEKTREEVDALIKRGFEVEFVEDPNAGHEHREEWNPWMIEWFKHPKTYELPKLSITETDAGRAENESSS